MQIDSKCIYEMYILLNKEIKYIKKSQHRGSKMQSRVETLVKHRNTLKFYLMKNGYVHVNQSNRNEYYKLKKEMEGEEKKEELSKGELIEKRNHYKSKWKEYCQLVKEQDVRVKELML